MRLRSEQLSASLKKQLHPIYLISGDETLLVQECCDTIRRHCREQGFTEREVHHVENHFDWGELLSSANSMSLFAERKIIELRFPNAKPGDKGSKALIEYAQNPPDDTVLLIICNQVPSAATRSKWYKAIDEAGATLPVWPIDYHQLPNWIDQRLGSIGLSASPDALQVLADRVEGNLLAAAQEIEKLALYAVDQRIDVETITNAVSDSSRYNVFDLVDRALAGDAPGSIKILHGLRGEGDEPLKLLWVLAREIRILDQCARSIADGMGYDQAMQSARIWNNRKSITRSALQRLSAPQTERLLMLCHQIDRTVKGLLAGDSWDLLAQLILALAGRAIRLPLAKS